MTAKRRALEAIRKHEKLVQYRSCRNNWCTENFHIVCGTVTINQLVNDGLVKIQRGGSLREAKAVLTDEGKR